MAEKSQKKETAAKTVSKKTPVKKTGERSGNIKKSTVKKTSAKNPIVVMKTNMGDMEIELYPQKAPVTVKNFLNYVEQGYYDGLIFHRVIPDFMIQGGGFSQCMDQKETNAPIKIESDNGLKNEKGTIAMARTNDPNSATSQFFINVADNDFLNFREPSIQGYGYAVFGKVVKGMETADKIAGVKTGRYEYFSDVPVEFIIIEEVKLK